MAPLFFRHSRSLSANISSILSPTIVIDSKSILYYNVIYTNNCWYKFNEVIILEPYKSIILKFIGENDEELSQSNLNINASEIVEGECYKALMKIKTLLESPFLKSTEKAVAIDRIISYCEDIGMFIK